MRQALKHMLRGAALVLPPVLLVRAARAVRDRFQAQGAELARAEAEAERARFLQHLDHEMKNPLMAIRAGLANLAGTDDLAMREQIRGSIEAQVIYLGKLVADLRKIATIESLPLEREPVAITALLADVLALAREEPEAATRALVLNPPDGDLVTLGDVDLLLHALYNLVQNALKFTRPGATITLEAYPVDGWVAIEVADTGPGIHPDDLPHVCEELYRGRGTAGIPGSGIGLALARAIAAQHDGDLVISSAPGEGTVARLYLVADDGTG